MCTVLIDVKKAATSGNTTQKNVLINVYRNMVTVALKVNALTQQPASTLTYFANSL